MAVQGLEQTTSRLDQAKRFGGLVIAAILIAALVVGVFIVSGLFSIVPTPQIRVLGVVVPPAWTAFIGAFSMALATILAYVYFAALIKSLVEKILAFWNDLPTRIQAMVLGLEAAAVAGLGLLVTHVLASPFGVAEMFVTVAVVWVVVTLVTLQVHDLGWTLAEWARTLNMGALIAALIALLFGFVFTGVAPGYAPPAVFIIAWAVCAYLLFRRRQTIEDSFVSNFLTRTGYAQMRQVDTLSVSVVTGLAFALVVAVLVGVAGTAPSGVLARTALSIAVVWPVVTFATSVGWPDARRTDLVIDDISVRSSTDMRELTIRNTGDEPVDLHGAKVLDATDRLYHIDINPTLGAGRTATFEIPGDFELATHERYDVLDLPVGLALMKDATEPVIVTRNGRAYVLYWIDQVADAE